MIGAHRNSEGEFIVRRDEHPTKRVNPSGEVVWIARYTNTDGQRRSAGSFAKKGPCKRAADGCCAQHAIYAAYDADREAPEKAATVGEYAETVWLRLHPRSERTDYTYQRRLVSVLDVKLGGRKLRDYEIATLERKHGVLLVDALLRAQGRAVTGAQGVLAVLSAMWQDALDDGYVKTANPFFRLKVRASDPRVQKAPRARALWSWAEMHAFCAAAGQHEAMLRVLSDCGLRIGEDFALQHRDLKLAQACDEEGCKVQGPHLHVRRRAWQGRLYAGTKSGPSRVAPLADAMAAMLAGLVRPFDARTSEALLFPTPLGAVWRDGNFRRDVWDPAMKASGIGAAPHDFRHAWVSYIRAAGIDVADAAAAAGHTVETATRTYTHPLGRSFDAMRRAVGE